MLKLYRYLRRVLLAQVLLGTAVFLLGAAADRPWPERFTWPTLSLVVLPASALAFFFVATWFFNPWWWPALLWAPTLILPGLVGYLPVTLAYPDVTSINIFTVTAILLLYLYVRYGRETFDIWSRFAVQYRDHKRRH